MMDSLMQQQESFATLSDLGTYQLDLNAKPTPISYNYNFQLCLISVVLNRYILLGNVMVGKQNNISRSCFQRISNPDSCLHHLFPPLRDTSVISRLRSTTPYPRPLPRTKNTSHSLTLDFILTISHLLQTISFLLYYYDFNFVSVLLRLSFGVYTCLLYTSPSPRD